MADVPDAIFPSDNEWGVPLLDITLQGEELVAPLKPWGAGGSRKRYMPGTYHFYTEDYRFEALWKDPSPVVGSGCAAVIEPNFSTNDTMPRAVGLWHVYRKRWLARYWQSFGIRVWVDLGVSTMHMPTNILGVPRGWRSFAVRGYTAKLNQMDEKHQLARLIADDDNPRFLVYGGGKLVREMCLHRGWLWIMEDRDMAKGKVFPPTQRRLELPGLALLEVRHG